MIGTVLGKIFGTRNERELKRLQPIVAAIGALEPGLRALSDEELRAKTAAFREKLAQGASLEDLKVEAFAVVREAGRRALGMRHFDVQLVGGLVLHEGTIAEMRTGEGKTLVATLPAYLNALEGKGVHVVTVNDYLARRDAEWMGRIYRFLGMSVGCIQHDLDKESRRIAYTSDVTYGTNNEFGFDYLRDNMEFTAATMVQQLGHHFAIVDEVDSILIDEARTPLIISGPSEGDVNKYYLVDRIVPRLHRRPGHRRGRAARGPGGSRGDRRLHRRHQGTVGDPDRTGRVPRREAARGLEPLRPQEHRPAPRHAAGAARPRALRARRRLHGRGRRGRDRRRVHRPEDARPPLVGRAAPGGRGQGRGQDPEREPDPRDDHLPELLPDVQEALGDDRHRGDRGQRVRRDLQARRDGDPHQPADGPRGQRRRDLPDGGGEAPGGRRGDQGAAREAAAGPGGHDLDREVGDDLRAAEEARRPARGAQRPAPRPRGRDRGAGRPARRRDDRDQHGRPRNRHPARRQPRVPGDSRSRSRRPGRPGPSARRRSSSRRWPARRSRPPGTTRRSSGWGACTSSAPSATRPGGSTTSCAAAPAARATRAPRGSTSRSKTT